MNERLKQRIEQFHRAVTRLEEACAQPEDAFLRDATIQRFEFTFELAWKMLMDRLREEGIQANGPAQVLRESVAMQWLEDGNRWTELHRMRNLTSHTYDEATARKVYRFICADGLPLFQALDRKARQW